MKRIIHFDLGKNMAYAHNGCYDFVVVDHFTAMGERPVRAAETLTWLSKLFYGFKRDGIQFDVVHYERPFTRGFDASRCLWGIVGVLEAVVGDTLPILDSTPQAIKSFSLGKAPKRVKMTSAEKTKANVAEKIKMIEAAQFLGYMGNNEHEADAFLGLKYAERYIT